MTESEDRPARRRLVFRFYVPAFGFSESTLFPNIGKLRARVEDSRK
jgi:hypothetical protein